MDDGAMIIYWNCLKDIRQDIFNKMFENVVKTFMPTSTNPFPPISVFYKIYNEIKNNEKMSGAYKTYKMIEQKEEDKPTLDDIKSAFSLLPKSLLEKMNKNNS